MVLAGLVLAGSLGSPARADAAEPTAAAVQRHLAETIGGAPNDFELVYERGLPDRGGAAEPTWAGKYVNRRDGQLHVVYGSGANVLAPGEVSQERGVDTATGALGAKADPALQRAIAEHGPKTLPVAVWFHVDLDVSEAAVRDRHRDVTWVAGRPLASSLDEARALRAELWRARRDAYAATAEELARAVERSGGTVAYVSTSAPVMFVDLPAPAVASLAGRAGVRSLGLETTWATQMASAGRTIRADWSPGSDDQGNGVRVAVVEYQNVRNTGDLAGQVIRSYSTTGRLSYGSGGADHPTWVGGAIASLASGYRGTAPGADLVSASTGGYTPSLTTDRAIIAAADWSISPDGGDADVINASIGQDTAIGAEEARRYFDSVGWEDGRLVVAAAGNYATFGNWDVVSPGTGYNVLTVGGVSDRNTPGPSDDRVWFVPGSNGSSFRDRTDAPWNRHGDYNKPNVSAPSVGVQTANRMIGDGTSVASPMVAGVAAQLIARAPRLATWPEGVRSIIMAGAVRRTPMPNGSIDADHEGVGTVDALWSNRILENGAYGGYRIGAMTAAETVVQSIPVVRGQRVRVALAWSSHTSGMDTAKADALTADLDLRVVNTNGAVTWAATFDNSYESIDVTAAGTGSLRVEIRPARFTAPEEPYGLAWATTGPFIDADDSMFRADILWIWDRGVTSGCAPSRFCPDTATTREQMASFLVRAGRLAPGTRDSFGDDDHSVHEGDINAIAAAGITGGCAPDRFCPGARVTRGQMASFLVRALDLPPTSRDFFTDDDESQHEAAINALAAAGITGGCATGRFCPTQTVTRGQMAAFLRRAYAP